MKGTQITPILPALSSDALATVVVSKALRSLKVSHASFNAMFKGKNDTKAIAKTKPAEPAEKTAPKDDVAILLQSGVALFHPPGHAPPEKRDGSAPEPKHVGQQNEISGTILDATSAKEIPAQAQDDKPQSSPLDSGPPAHSQAAPVPQVIPNAPDLLSRMLARAVVADTRVNGSVVPIVTDGKTPSVPVLAAKFAAAIETVVKHGDSSSPATPLGVASAFTAPATRAASATPIVHSTPVDASAVVEQVVKALIVRTDPQGTSEIRLHLSPAHLGDLSMKITVQGGQISANVVTQNVDVRNALMTGQHQLARSLADAGLSLTGFSVDLSGGDAGSKQNRDRTTGFGRRYVVHEMGASEEPETATISNLGPSIAGAASLGLFNYLA